MDGHARERLAQFGTIFTSLGAAAQLVGESLIDLELIGTKGSNLQVVGHLLAAADACEMLAQSCVSAPSPGYDENDATTMALVFRVFRRIGDAVSQISAYSLHDPTGVKFETWTEVAAHLREAALAAHNQGHYAERPYAAPGDRPPGTQPRPQFLMPPQIV